MFPQIRDAFLRSLSSADQQGLDGDRWGSLQIYVVFILNLYYKQQIHHHQSLQNHIAIIFRQENWTRDVPWRPVIYDIFYALHFINYLLFIILHKLYMILYSGKRAGQGMFPDNQSLIEAGLATRLNNLTLQTPNNYWRKKPFSPVITPIIINLQERTTTNDQCHFLLICSIKSSPAGKSLPRLRASWLRGKTLVSSGGFPSRGRWPWLKGDIILCAFYDCEIFLEITSDFFPSVQRKQRLSLLTRRSSLTPSTNSRLADVISLVVLRNSNYFFSFFSFFLFFLFFLEMIWLYTSY